MSLFSLSTPIEKESVVPPDLKTTRPEAGASTFDRHHRANFSSASDITASCCSKGISARLKGFAG